MKEFICDYNKGHKAEDGRGRFTITESELPQPLDTRLDSLKIGETYVYPSFGIAYTRTK